MKLTVTILRDPARIMSIQKRSKCKHCGNAVSIKDLTFIEMPPTLATNVGENLQGSGT